MEHHFSSVSTQYRDLRTTDAGPILHIAARLKSRERIRLVDAGCGAGRYDLMLLQHLPRLHLLCMDYNAAMLAQGRRFLTANGMKNLGTVRGSANEIPLAGGSCDGLVSFNALHHFDIPAFLRSGARVLKDSGQFFIYTRLRSQNARNVWERFFPGFSEKETRLLDTGDMERIAADVEELRLHEAQPFRFERCASLQQLEAQARGRHYSAFSLYTEDEFEKALRSFRESVTAQYGDPARVEWTDENILFEFHRI